jgi:hypothetical protein
MAGRRFQPHRQIEDFDKTPALHADEIGEVLEPAEMGVRGFVETTKKTADLVLDEAVSVALVDAGRLECDFADSLIAALNCALGCATTATFDKRAASRLETMSAVVDNL